jgi:aminopeptidase 2
LYALSIFSYSAKPPNPSTKVDAMYALCATRQNDLIDRTFKMLDDGSVKDQDMYIFAVSVCHMRHDATSVAGGHP